MRVFHRLSKHVLSNPVRLGIMIFLYSREKCFFSDLQKVLEITPGNLDSHLKILQKAEFVEISKVISDRPRTLVRVTEKGKIETLKFLEELKKVVDEFIQERTSSYAQE